MRIFTNALLASALIAMVAPVSGPAFAQSMNTNTTIQEGGTNRSSSRQSGDDNLNTTIQTGRNNSASNRQRGCVNTNELGQTTGRRGRNTARNSQGGRC